MNKQTVIDSKGREHTFELKLNPHAANRAKLQALKAQHPEVRFRTVHLLNPLDNKPRRGVVAYVELDTSDVPGSRAVEGAMSITHTVDNFSRAEGQLAAFQEFLNSSSIMESMKSAEMGIEQPIAPGRFIIVSDDNHTRAVLDSVTSISSTVGSEYAFSGCIQTIYTMRAALGRNRTILNRNFKYNK